MKKEDYGKLLKDPRWQRKRLEIMQRDNFACVLCGDTESTLHVHHGYYKAGKKPWEYPDNTLMTLCEQCHEEVTFQNEEVDNMYQSIKDGLIENGFTLDVLFNLFWEINEFLYSGKWSHTVSLIYNAFRFCFNETHDLELFDKITNNGGFYKNKFVIEQNQKEREDGKD